MGIESGWEYRESQMQVIKKARSRVAKAWGIQKVRDTSYRLLTYTLPTDWEEGLLLHNVMTGELLQLDQEEKLFLESLPGRVPDQYRDLIEKHFLVPEDYDERKATGQIRRVLTALQNQKDITGYTILPTTHCNARCFYCYECNYEHLHMTRERAHEVVQYIIDHSHGKKVSLQWFGGEPLVGGKIISQICRELTDLGVEFTSSMISNGALFDAQMVEEARELWKLKSLQITIDGTEEVYNRVKDYVGMKGSPYRRVLANIRLLAQAGIRVSIRINLGFHNVDDTRQLIEELSQTFAGEDQVSMYVHELFEGEGTEPRTYTEEEKDYLTNLVLELNDDIARKGKYRKDKSLPALILSHCMADKDGSVIIQPGGQLTKCEHSSALEQFGTIDSPEWDLENIGLWKTHAELPQCWDCPLYPSCIWPVKCPSTGECRKAMRRKKIEDTLEAMEEAARDSREKRREEDKRQENKR